jgi:HD superfamily phosphodiesterase
MRTERADFERGRSAPQRDRPGFARSRVGDHRRFDKRFEALETYLQRTTEIESIAKGFAGVYEVYAVQGGREIRVIVAPQSVDDLGARELASMIATHIEAGAAPPMPIKVTVIREFRASASTRDPSTS